MPGACSAPMARGRRRSCRGPAPPRIWASFGPLSEREVDYLVAQEWADEADDILWRRSKLGLHLSQDQQAALQNYMAARNSAVGSKRAIAN